MSTKHNPTAKKSDQKKPTTKSAKPSAASKPATKKRAAKPAAKAQATARDKAPTVEVAPIANDSRHDAPTDEPAAIGATEPGDATTGAFAADDAASAPPLGACARCGRTDVALRTDGALTLHDAPDGAACNPPTATAQRDVIDVLIWRARATTPEALGHFLEATPSKDLRAMQVRLMGNNERLSRTATIAKIAAALASPPADAEAKRESSHGTPATENDASATGQKAPRESVARDLPPVGTVVVKRDRTGAERARCTIVEGGVEHSGTIHKSLSGAAIAAAHSLGLAAKQLNGWAWWGLVKPPKAPATKKGVDLDAIAKLWARYHERVEVALKIASADEKPQLHLALSAHSTALLHLAGESAGE